MKKNKNLKIYLFAVFVIVFSFILLYLTFSYVNDQIIKEILKSVSYSLITAALFTMIGNKLQRDTNEENLRDLISEKIPFLLSLKEAGFDKVDNSFPLKESKYYNDFLASDEVVIVMNDGKRFFSNNIDLFRQRFALKNKKTTFILLDPDTHDSISVLTRKNGHEGNYYVNKINEFIKELKKEKIHEKHKLDIYTQNLYTTMSIILMDSFAMFSLYRISPGQDIVPHFIYTNTRNENSEYMRIKNDVKKLLKDGTKK